MTDKNKKIIFAKRPTGLPEAESFKFIDDEITAPNEGQVLIKTLYLSVDPYMRGRMSDAKSYVPSFKLDEPFAGSGIGEVIESKSALFNKGDIVGGTLTWEKYPVAAEKDIRKLDPNLAPLTANLGVLGMTGLTAYFGLIDIGNPKPGETVVVSGAAGAVGIIVGQIAKILGCHVVGIAGSDDKIKYLTEELGFDTAINYKTTKDIRAALSEACPNGIDVYFDNVGGEISDAAISLINTGARIPLCGQISLYNATEAQVGPRTMGQLLVKMALVKGFIIFQYAERFPEGIEKLAGWLAEGKLKTAENIIEGFENVPNAFIGLFKGENTGKQIVKI